MPGMRIEIAKRADGGAVLRCVRGDGTVSWQRQSGPQAAFFPLHDLTHFAVETVLGARDAFFGLVAQGWEIEDTTGKGARGALPRDAVVVEHIVGFLDVERATGGEWTADDYIAQLTMVGVVPAPQMRAAITDVALVRIRDLRRDLFGRWATTPAGEMLELVFDDASSSGEAR